MERTAKTVEMLRAEKPSRKRFRDDGTSTEHVWFYGSRGYRTCSTELCWEVSIQERFISTAVRKLSTGTWVSVGPLRTVALVEGAPYLQDVVIALEQFDLGGDPLILSLVDPHGTTGNRTALT